MNRFPGQNCPVSTSTTTTVPISTSETGSSATGSPAAAAPPISDFNVAQKVIIVTGGGRGLGLTQALALVEAGATVYALDILPTTGSDFPSVPGLHYKCADVRDAVALQALLREIADVEGRVDGMIAAAGVLEEVKALDYTPQQFSRILDINLTGAFLSAQACAREMIRLRTRGGSICIVASMSGVIANRDVHMAAYNASKAAVHQLARSLASEWGPTHGIRVNTLSPGYITTKMVEELFERFPERRQTWSEQNMLGRLSAPEEYRGAALFLMSDASSYMTGADLMIDGGHRAW